MHIDSKVVFYFSSLLSRFSSLFIIAFASIYLKEEYKSISILLMFSFIGFEFINNWISALLPRTIDEKSSLFNIKKTFITLFFVSWLISGFCLYYLYSKSGLWLIAYIGIGSFFQLLSLFLVSSNKYATAALSLIVSSLLKFSVLFLEIEEPSTSNTTVLLLLFIITLIPILNKSFFSFLYSSRFFLYIAFINILEVRFDSYIYSTILSDELFILVDHILKAFMVFAAISSLIFQRLNIAYYNAEEKHDYKKDKTGSKINILAFLFFSFFTFLIISYISSIEYYSINYENLVIVFFSIFSLYFANAILLIPALKLIRNNKEHYLIILQVLLIALKVTIFLSSVNGVDLIVYLSLGTASCMLIWGILINKRMKSIA